MRLKEAYSGVCDERQRGSRLFEQLIEMIRPPWRLMLFHLIGGAKHVSLTITKSMLLLDCVAYLYLGHFILGTLN